MKIFFLLLCFLGASTVFCSSEEVFSSEKHLSEQALVHNSPWTDGKFPYEDCKIQTAFSTKGERFAFQGNLKAKGESAYPQFESNDELFQTINQKLSDNAKKRLREFISKVLQEEESLEEFDQEAQDIDFDKRELEYKITPIYASDRLVSIFGELDYYAGLPHGSTHYYGYNYWREGQQIHELTLESLFDPEKDYGNFLIEYCMSTLKRDHVGYCSSNSEGDIPIEIELKDLNIFTLSENGLTITFQPYHVGGWADGPYFVTIPFQTLKHLIKPNGPLSEFVEKS